MQLMDCPLDLWCFSYLREMHTKPLHQLSPPSLSIYPLIHLHPLHSTPLHSTYPIHHTLPHHPYPPSSQAKTAANLGAIMTIAN